MEPLEVIYMKKKNYSKTQLILLLKEWAQAHGQPPSKRQLCEDATMPSDMAYRTAFGSWGNALIEAGFDVQKPFPSTQCRNAVSKAKKGKIGVDSSHWKGGKIKSHGYILKWDSESSSYKREHRLIMEKHIGRKLKDNEDIHHLNGVKDDNRIENLMILTKSKHTELHEKNGRNHTRKNMRRCVYPDCHENTSGRYGLCCKHYKAQWQRVRNGIVNNLLDFSIPDRRHTEATKKMLSEYAKKQPRQDGRFGNIHDTKGEE